jgi:hypothetical protein
MCAVFTVIFRICNTMRLSLIFVVTFSKRPINPITNPNPFYTHSKNATILQLTASVCSVSELTEIEWQKIWWILQSACLSSVLILNQWSFFTSYGIRRMKAQPITWSLPWEGSKESKEKRPFQVQLSKPWSQVLLHLENRDTITFDALETRIFSYLRSRIWTDRRYVRPKLFRPSGQHSGLPGFLCFQLCFFRTL